jgi:hypothetical protein
MRRELKVDHQDGHLPRAQGRNLMRRELKALSEGERLERLCERIS